MQSLPDSISFGEFEVDVRSRTLKKNSVTIRLQEQPFRLLLILLTRHGSVVTRDCLRTQLWAADTFVDFGANLNTAVRKLRAALDDSAADPRFIETVPRLGYRFVHPIEFPVWPERAVVSETRLRVKNHAGLVAAVCLVCALLFFVLVSRRRGIPSSLGNEVEALEMTLRGRQLLSSRDDPDSLATARELFERRLQRTQRWPTLMAGLHGLWPCSFPAGTRREHASHRTGSSRASVVPAAGQYTWTCSRILLSHGSGRLQQSLLDAERVLALAPNSAEALLAAGNAYHSAGLLEQAGSFFDRGLRISPDSVPLRTAVARNHRFRGEYGRGVAILEPIVERRLGGAVELMELYNLLHQYKAAHRIAESSVSQYGDNAVFWYQWYRARVGAGDREDARQKLVRGARIAEAIASTTENARTEVQVALLYANLNDRAQAAKHLTTALRAQENHSWTLFFAGISWAILGEEEQALSYLEQAHDGGFAPLHYLDYFSSPEVIGSDSLRRSIRYQRLRDRVYAEVPRIPAVL